VAQELRQISDGFELASRYAGRQRVMNEVVDTIVQSLSSVRLIQEGESVELWRETVDRLVAPLDSEFVWVRVRAKPAETFDLLEEIVDSAIGSNAVLAASPGLGTIDIRWNNVDFTGDELAARVSRLRAIARHAIVMSAPTALKLAVDAWGDSVESLDLMWALKHEFDPAGILNPGRFAGGI
jgi:FAD/FMN-containing dehydrogenase